MYLRLLKSVDVEKLITSLSLKEFQLIKASLSLEDKEEVKKEYTLYSNLRKKVEILGIIHTSAKEVEILFSLAAQENLF